MMERGDEIILTCISGHSKARHTPHTSYGQERHTIAPHKSGENVRSVDKIQVMTMTYLNESVQRGKAIWV